MKKKKEFRVPKRKQPVWRPTAAILRLFYKKPKIVNLNDELPQRAILVANHAAMGGPMIYALHLPVFHATWGAHQMLGNYRMRFHYLRDVYFMQKRGMKKFPASLIAAFEAAFSIYFYRGMKMLPTFMDARFATTIRNSVTCLENDVSVMIFPEDSSEGYHDILTSFFNGFVILAERYRKKTGEDVDICPVYFCKRKNIIYIGKSSKLSDYPDSNRDQIADEFRRQVNALYTDYVCKDCADSNDKTADNKADDVKTEKTCEATADSDTQAKYDAHDETTADNAQVQNFDTQRTDNAE